MPRSQAANSTELPFQEPHGHGEVQGKLLEQAIGREVKGFREKLGLTIAELAKAADMSAGMLSKIENGATSPSLASLQALGKALQVPVTAFFKGYRGNPRRHFRQGRPGADHRAARHQGRAPVPASRPQPAWAGDGRALSHHADATSPTCFRPSSMRAWNSSICWREMSSTATATRPMTCIPATLCSSTPTRRMGRKNCGNCRSGICR